VLHAPYTFDLVQNFGEQQLMLFAEPVGSPCSSLILLRADKPVCKPGRVMDAFFFVIPNG